MITPSKRNFLELVRNGKLPPLHKEIPYFHPHLIYESLASPNSFLLESMKGPMKIARYSFIGFDPYAVFKVKNGRIEIETTEGISRECKLKKDDKYNPPIPPLEKGGKGGFEKGGLRE